MTFLESGSLTYLFVVMWKISITCYKCKNPKTDKVEENNFYQQSKQKLNYKETGYKKNYEPNNLLKL